MAKGKITKSDLISNDVKKGLQELRTEIDLTVKSFKELKAEAKKINQEIKGADTFGKVSKGAKSAATNVAQLTKEEKRLKKATEELNFQLSKEGKELAKVQQKVANARSANRAFAKSQVAATKSTFKLGQVMKSFLFTANFMANVMSSLVSKVTQFAKKIITEGVRGVVSFDSAITDVRAIAQATDEQFQKLRKSAIDLGGATKFTATQVAELQKEYAKLGFTTDQIIGLQEATLKLATATGAELAPAAKVVGGALRSFEKGAKQAGAVAATLAIATTKSALAFEDYETILGTVGAVSNQFGFSLEDTLALLGQLRNANLDASKSATAFRNILLNLADSNGALAQELGGNVSTLEGFLDALEQLNEEGVDLASALELTDKRSVNAFLALSKTTRGALALRDGITDVNKELDEMVDTQLTSLENQLTLLTSAWQGYIQKQSDVGNATTTASSGIGALTSVLQSLTVSTEKESEATGRFGLIMKNLSRPLGRAIALSGFYSDELTKMKDAAEEAAEENAVLTKVLQEGGFAEFAKDLGKVRVAQDALNEQGDVEKIITIQTLVNELKELRDIRKDLSVDEIANTNREIQILEAKISKLQELGKVPKIAIAPDPKEVEDDLDDALDAFSTYFDDVSAAGIKAAEERTALRLKQEENALNREIEFEKFLAKVRDDERKRRVRLEAEAEMKLAELKQQLGNEVFNALAALNDRQLENKEAAANEEIAILDSKMTKELSNERLTADQRLAIQDKYTADKLVIEERIQAESLKLRRRAALIDKAMALFNIFLETKKAIATYSSNPVTLPLVPFIKALGVAQAIAVAAAPIPQFAKGTDSSPEGLAVVGEKGSELMIDKKGNISLSPDKASLAYLDKGTQIIPSDITQSLLAQKALSSSYDGQTDILLKRNNSLLEKIAKKPVASSTMTSSGILTAVHSGSTVMKKMRRYFT